MKFLLTNDDGVFSIGIQTAAKRLSDEGHEVLVVAPDRERSGSGHAMTLDKPLSLSDIDRKFLLGDFAAKASDGLPTDCVVLGLEVLGFEPDMVISGINQGPNVADDLTYSGTACAAMEGLIAGYPALAMSLDCGSHDQEIHNDTAAEVMMSLISWFSSHPIRSGLMYNVNVPNVPLAELKGVRITRKGVRRYTDKIKIVKSPAGIPWYWIGGHIEDDLSADTDVSALAANYASVTPVHMEMTCFEEFRADKLNSMEQTLENFLKL